MEMDGLLSSRTVEARSSGSRARVDDDGAARVSVIAGKFARVCVCGRRRTNVISDRALYETRRRSADTLTLKNRSDDLVCYYRSNATETEMVVASQYA